MSLIFTREKRKLHVIAIDEELKQIVSDRGIPMPIKTGSPEGNDYEYVRKGTADIFVVVEFKAGKRMTRDGQRKILPRL
jgi:hypothetical protein